jgi:hypothetical protein
LLHIHQDCAANECFANITGAVYQVANKISNVSYDQIPHIVINHPETNPEHQSIMRALFKILKDKHQCIYSNEALIEECRIPERTLRRRLDELESWGFINRIGKSYARRFSLGILFNTTAMVAGSKLNTPAKSTETPAKSDPNTGHHGRYTNSSTKPSSKENISSLTSTPKNQKPTQQQIQDFNWYNDRPEFKLPDELIWIRDYLLN